MPTRTLPRWAAILLTALLYLGAAKLGLSLAFVAEQVTVVWPPTGIALAAILLLGWRVWPGIALGAFLANLTVHEPIWTACGIAAGNTLAALAAGALLRWSGFQPSLSRSRDVAALVLFASVLSTTLGASA